MMTNRLPFEGASNGDVIAAILGKEPPPLARYARDVPEALEWIVTKALTKDPEERYQTAKEMMVDLRRIKQRLDAHAEIERSTAPDSAHIAPGISASTGAEARSSAQVAQRSTAGSGVSTAPAVSSAEYIVSEIKRHKTGIGVIAALVVLGVLAGGIWIYKLATSNKSTGPAAIKFTRLTSGGKIGNELIVGGATISPDGKYVVFWTQDQDKSSCYVRQISTNSLVRIVGPTEMDGGGTTFSPDGEFIYFKGSEKNNPDGTLFKVPVLGGTPQKILDGIWSPVSFSPDGKQIAYARLFPSTGESRLIVANADGSGMPRTIAMRKLPDYYSQDGPAWSPDGKKIAIGAATIPEVNSGTVVEVPSDGGKEHAITPPQWSYVSRVLWLRDGSGLVMTLFPAFASLGTQIWYVSYPQGMAHPITNDLNGYGTISLGLTGDSNTLVTVQEDFTRTISLMTPSQDAAQARQISSGKYEGLFSLDSTADGRIVYLDSTGNGSEIWIMKSDGTEKRQLTSDGALKVKASITRGGRYILFNSNRSGSFNIWRMDLDGNNQKQLTNNETFAVGAVGSADDQWVVYHSFREGKWGLSKVPVDGGDAISLTEKQCAWPAVSPDGKSIACLSLDEKANLKPQIAIIPFAGGPVSRLVDLSSGFNFDGGLRWAPDGRSITYIEASGSAGNIHSQPIDGGPAKSLTTFKSDRISAFNWTRDGKQLILGRGPTIDEVVLIKDFR
jgi:Tol biopolymer transport system component